MADGFDSNFIHFSCSLSTTALSALEDRNCVVVIEVDLRSGNNIRTYVYDRMEISTLRQYLLRTRKETFLYGTRVSSNEGGRSQVPVDWPSQRLESIHKSCVDIRISTACRRCAVHTLKSEGRDETTSTGKLAPGNALPHCLNVDVHCQNRVVLEVW